MTTDALTAPHVARNRLVAQGPHRRTVMTYAPGAFIEQEMRRAGFEDIRAFVAAFDVSWSISSGQGLSFRLVPRGTALAATRPGIVGRKLQSIAVSVPMIWVTQQIQARALETAEDICKACDAEWTFNDGPDITLRFETRSLQ